MIALLDPLMDAAVVPGYTSVGFRVRRRGWRDLPRMDGRVAVVTGATSGIGLAACEGLAALGARVWMLARDPARGEDARARVVAHTRNEDVAVLRCDLADLADVRRAAAQLRQREPELHALVHNAGVLPAQRTETAGGLELTFATNVAAPFLLTAELLEPLRRGAPSRIVNVSSGGMYAQRLHADDLQMAGEPFDGTTAYARTKRAEVVLTELWAQRLRGSGVVVHAMHPGWADTPGLQTSLPAFRRVVRPLLRTPQEGADTIVWLCAADEPAAQTGGFWHDRRRRPVHRVPWTREHEADRRALWDACVRLTGVDEAAL